MEVGGHRRTTLMESVFSNHAFGSSIMAGCDGGRRFDPAGLPDPHSHQTSRFGNDISSFNEDKSSRPDLHRCRWTDVRRLVSTWDAPFAAINESPSHPSVRRPSLRCLKLNHLLLTFLITAGTFMRRPAAHKPNAINNRHFPAFTTLIIWIQVEMEKNQSAKCWLRGFVGLSGAVPPPLEQMRGDSNAARPYGCRPEPELCSRSGLIQCKVQTSSALICCPGNVCLQHKRV